MELEKIQSIVDDDVLAMRIGDVINCFRSHDLLKPFNKLVSVHLDEKSTLKSPRQKISDPNGKDLINFKLTKL